MLSDTSWLESTLTWNNKPVNGSFVGSVTVASNSFALRQFDITAQVNAAILNGDAHISFTLQNPVSSTAITRIRAKEHSSNSAAKLLLVP